MKVRAKKHLGQHFLNDLQIAENIVHGLTFNNYTNVLEIGPGMGVLTQFLLKIPGIDFKLIEIDGESIAYLIHHFPDVRDKIVHDDFLKSNILTADTEPIAIIGNFPYNISSQILFKAYHNRNKVVEVVGMFQKEVAERIASGPGTKKYGILSVLLQAFYDIEYLFTVDEHAFSPPPKVKSGVIRLKRNDVKQLGCDEKSFMLIVKATFNQRRKTIRNGLKSILPGKIETEHPLLTKRPEQLSVNEFVELTNLFFPKP